MDKKGKLEILLWSITLPGVGQFLNGSYLKGFLIIGSVILVNIQSNFNKVVVSSFHGDIQKSIEQTDYQWFMFYPCLYTFAIWDAYKDAAGRKSSYAFLPFVFSAYFATVGLIFSTTFKMMGLLLGPVWLPMLSVLPGVVVGLLLQKLLNRNSR